MWTSDQHNICYKGRRRHICYWKEWWRPHASGKCQWYFSCHYIVFAFCVWSFWKPRLHNNSGFSYSARTHHLVMLMALQHYYPCSLGHLFNDLHRLSSLGSIQNHLCPHRYPFTSGWREAIIVKRLAQGHKCHVRDSMTQLLEHEPNALNHWPRHAARLQVTACLQSSIWRMGGVRFIYVYLGPAVRQKATFQMKLAQLGFVFGVLHRVWKYLRDNYMYKR